MLSTAPLRVPAAALGRDRAGGATVNLTPSDRPQDVYSAVADALRARVERDAAAGDPVAQSLVGEVNRKLVKQTVMTTVYGVTFIGARDQILSRLTEVREAAACIRSVRHMRGCFRLLSCSGSHCSLCRLTRPRVDVLSLIGWQRTTCMWAFCCIADEQTLPHGRAAWVEPSPQGDGRGGGLRGAADDPGGRRHVQGGAGDHGVAGGHGEHCGQAEARGRVEVTPRPHHPAALHASPLRKE